jgi:hypothetical protein
MRQSWKIVSLVSPVASALSKCPTQKKHKLQSLHLTVLHSADAPSPSTKHVSVSPVAAVVDVPVAAVAVPVAAVATVVVAAVAAATAVVAADARPVAAVATAAAAVDAPPVVAPATAAATVAATATATVVAADVVAAVAN